MKEYRSPGGGASAIDRALDDETEEPPSGESPPDVRSRPILLPRRERFPISPEADEFRRRFYPGTANAEWNDWHWQLRRRIRDRASLERLFVLSEDERTAVDRRRGPLPLGITPYYASRMDVTNPSDPLRRTHIPVAAELRRGPGEADDPLGEDGHAPVPGLVHRYPDRVLFLVSSTCATYCRYCTRSRMVGNRGSLDLGTAHWERALAYIADHSEIRDVLLSGGDPLTLADDKLDGLLRRLRGIPHVEIIRLGTKVPAVLPMRVTRDLTRMLRRHHPLWMSIHFTHPDELSPEVTEACARLADAGVPLGSQTVLLQGVNDDAATLERLFHGLLMRRVRPYYLYQCDPISGSAHFRTPVEKGLDIIRGLRGHTSGYAVPIYVIDAPGGGGKVPLLPDYVRGRDGDDLLLTNFEGKTYRYCDPSGSLGTERGPG